MRVIHKFQFNLAKVPMPDVWEVVLPAGTEIVSFQMQGNFPTMWYLRDPEIKETVSRRFKLAFTGEGLPSEIRYWGTVFHMYLVIHLVELLP